MSTIICKIILVGSNSTTLGWVCFELLQNCQPNFVARSHVGSRKSGCYSVRLMVAQSSFRLAYNGLGLGEGRAFEIRQLGLSTNVDRSTNVQLLPSALLLPNPC